MRTVRNQTIVRQQIPLVCLVVLVIALECHAELKAKSALEINSASDYSPDARPQESCQLHAKAIWEGQALFRELFEAMPKFVAIASAGFYEFEATDVRESFEPDCVDSSNDHSCWNSIEEYSDGQEWRLLLSTNESLLFRGRSNCTNQKLSGSGTTTWRWTSRWDLRVVRGMGEWSNGKQEGIWTYEIFSAPCVGLTHIECRLSDESANALKDFEDGPPFQPGVASKFEGTYRNGLRTGFWAAIFNNGDATEIPYESDSKHGTQTYSHMVLESYENEQLIDRYEVPWYEGMKHGLQVQNSWNGDREEIPWIEGTMHGESIYRWSTGETEKVTWLNGRQHDISIFNWPDGSRLITLYDEGLKIGYEVFSPSIQESADSVSLETSYSEKEEFNGRSDLFSAWRRITRRQNGTKHGVEIYLHPVYGVRVYSPYRDGKLYGTTIRVQERLYEKFYHSLSYEFSRSRILFFDNLEYEKSVLVAQDGYRRESPGHANHMRQEYLIQLLSNGSYRSFIRYENGRQQGTSIRCWYDPIPWEDEGMKGINVFDWRDGVIGYYTWPYVSWHGPLSATDPNGLCLETPYTKSKKSGIEIQTQTNGYKAHIPMRGRFLAGKLIVIEPKGSRK